MPLLGSASSVAFGTRTVPMLLVIACGGGMARAQPSAFPALPLGSEGSVEKRTVEEIAPGLYHHHIVRGRRTDGPGWAIALPPARSRTEAALSAACITALGHSPTTLRYRAPGPGGMRYSVTLGGAFATQAEARASLPAAASAGCAYAVQHRAADPDMTTGPWSVHVLEIVPSRYRGRLFSALATDIARDAATTSSIAKRQGALAAVNGGFFAMRAEEGVPGEPSGLAVVDGRLRSEATADRPYLLLQDSSPPKATVIAESVIDPPEVRWADGRAMRIDGIDRPPGLIRNCGLRGARPTERPAHDITCTNPDELVVLTPDGAAVPPAGAAMFMIRSGGRIERSVADERPAPGELLLVATGKRIAAVEARMRRGVTASVDLHRLGRGRFVVSGGPLLIVDGRPWRRDGASGWALDRTVSPERAATVHAWINRRNPRTAAGVTRDGRLLLLTVDGRGYERPAGSVGDASVGMTIEELRTVMARLGAEDALNLDGGGSTTMVVSGQIVNRPSDSSGERPVGDAIILAEPGND